LFLEPASELSGSERLTGTRSGDGFVNAVAGGRGSQEKAKNVRFCGKSSSTL
jgi:hypothetical protein